MSEKHYPYYGGNFDRIVCDRDGSVWVQEVKLRDVEAENAKLRELVRCLVYSTNPLDRAKLIENAVELGIEVTP